MPRPIPDNVRQAVLDDIRAGDLSCRAIAAKHEVSTAFVSRLAKATGEGDGWQRSKTARATRAREIDLRDLRSRLAVRNYQRAHRVHDRLDEPVYRWKQPTVDGGVITLSDVWPPARDERELAAAIGSYTTAADRVTDDDGGAANAKSMLGALAEALEVAAEHLPDESE